MFDSLVFNTPAGYKAGLISGEFIRIGALIKSTQTGKIVAHIQESGLAQQAFSMMSGGPLSLALGAGNWAVNAGYGYVLNNKMNVIDRKVDLIAQLVQDLKLISVSTLGVSVVGVGVSLLGFYYLGKRLDDVDRAMDGLREEIGHFRMEVRESLRTISRSQLREHSAKVNALQKNAAQAKYGLAPSAEYRNIADQLSYEAQYFFETLSDSIQHAGRLDLNEFKYLTDMLILINCSRIDCLLLAGESGRALNTVIDIGESYRSLFDPVTSLSFGPTNPDQSDAVVTCLRDLTDAALTKPHLIEHLVAERVDYAAFIERLESERDQPVLMIQAGR